MLCKDGRTRKGWLINSSDLFAYSILHCLAALTCG